MATSRWPLLQAPSHAVLTLPFVAALPLALQDWFPHWRVDVSVVGILMFKLSWMIRTAPSSRKSPSPFGTRLWCIFGVLYTFVFFIVLSGFVAAKKLVLPTRMHFRFVQHAWFALATKDVSRFIPGPFQCYSSKGVPSLNWRPFPYACNC